MATDFIRCDGEFSEIGEDLDMTNFGVVKHITSPVEYAPPDISLELVMLKRYSQKGEKMVKVGTKVIVRTCKEYGGRLTGKVGTVSQIWYKDEKVGILFEDIKNPESENGLFWIPDKCVTPYSQPKAMLNTDDVRKVIFNENKTIILWNDGTKTIATCGEGDNFDLYAGFCAAVVKHVFGSTGTAKRALKKANNTMRKQEIEVNAVKVGDQIQVGKYTATCQKLADGKAIFLLDQYLDKPYPMNKRRTNEGGYDASDLRSEFKNIILDHNFDGVRDLLVPFTNGDLMRIPTVGEMFGYDDYYEMDDAEQWELMKDRRNRIAIREGDEYEWGWLQNKVKNSAAFFAGVNYGGAPNYDAAAGPWVGVRPVFQLVG